MAFICTKENPWKKEYGRAIHPDAVYVDDEYGPGHDDYDVYECPNCGKVFYETIPN